MRQILTRKDLLIQFTQLDELLLQKTEVVLLGAAALIILNLRERATIDIDIANVKDAPSFFTAAKSIGLQVDIVSVSTTVDFNSCPTLEVFTGRFLHVYSVTEKDLIKLKLERYRKQDSGDIDEIIRKINLSYDAYSELVIEAALNYIGNIKVFILNALLAAENHYTAEQVVELRKKLESKL